MIIEAEMTLREGGRTFHWARRFLGQGMGQDAARLYAFCRLLDDLADGDLPHGSRRLRSIHDSLTGITRDTDPALMDFRPFMREKNLPDNALISLIEGLLMDQETVRLNTKEDLLRYSYHVAGTVGVMMCRILGSTNHDAPAFAIDLGIAMQLTNIARDVLEDARMGRRYLPAEWVGGITPQEIALAAEEADAMMIKQVAEGVMRTLSLAETYYESGIKGLSHLPLRAHVAILIAARAYRQIGIQLAYHGCNWQDGRQVTSTLTKAWTSLTALPLMRHRSRDVPAHDNKLHHALAGLPHARG